MGTCCRESCPYHSQRLSVGLQHPHTPPAPEGDASDAGECHHWCQRHPAWHSRGVPQWTHARPG